jgi:hypothetical protein
VSTVETLEPKPKKFSIPAATEEQMPWKPLQSPYQNAFSVQLANDDDVEHWINLPTHAVAQAGQCLVDKNDPKKSRTVVGNVVFYGPKAKELFFDLTHGKADQIQVDGRNLLSIVVEKEEPTAN